MNIEKLCTMILTAAVALLLLFSPAARADSIFGAALGINGVFTDQDVRPGGYEAGAAVKASLSPHLSGIGGVWYGITPDVDDEYARATVGFNITATDVNRRDFSIAVGGHYQVSTNESAQPEAWYWHATLGWQPLPQEWKRVILTMQGRYATKIVGDPDPPPGEHVPREAGVIVGLRYMIGGAQ